MYIKERRTREGKEQGKESFCKLKLEQENLFYNLVSLEEKVKQTSNLPQNKAAKKRVKIKKIGKL